MEGNDETFHDDALDFENCEILDSFSSSSFFPFFFFKKGKIKIWKHSWKKKFAKYLYAKRRPRGCSRETEYVYEFGRKAFE